MKYSRKDEYVYGDRSTGEPFLWRLKVPNGWILRCEESIIFLLDQNHEWELEDES